MSQLTELFDHKIDFIIKDNLVSQEQALRLVDCITHHPAWEEIETPGYMEKALENQKKPMHIFYNQFFFSLKGLHEKEYFEAIKPYHAIWKTITDQCQCDPFLMFIDYLKNSFGVDVQLAKRGNSSYFPVVIRAIPDEGLPHGDYAPFEAKGWAIENVIKQIAWNLYLTDPAPGGETDLYEELWLQESQIPADTYGLQEYNVPVRNSFAPKPGRVVLFNSQRFHSVRKSTAPRIAIAGFIGQTKEGQIVAWS